MKAIPPVLALCLLAGLTATAQEDLDRPIDVVTQGIVKIPIAVPEATGVASSVAEEMIRTIRDDLEFSGFFEIVDPERYALVGPTLPGQVPHSDWLGIGADALTLTEVVLDDDQIRFLGWLYAVDRDGSDKLFSHVYRGSRDNPRKIAHYFSDDLIKHFTGRPGVARTKIAFVSPHEDGVELYMMDYDGQRLLRLTSTGSLNLAPTWSPDGRSLAFVSWRRMKPEIFIWDNTGNLRAVPVVAGELNAAPEWSPDGTKLVYASDAAGDPELYVLDLTTNRNTRLTRSRAIEMAPAFSSTGREIAFTSDRTGQPQIYLMDAEGLNVRRISYDSDYSDSAAFSPDGKRLAWVSRIDGYFQIMVLDLETQGLTQVTQGRYHHENPRWSPDGRHLVFSSNRRGTYDIYTMTRDGGEMRRLTRLVDSRTPDWSR